MNAPTDSAGTRHEQVCLKRSELEDILSSAEKAEKLALAASRLLDDAVKGEGNDHLAVYAASGVASAMLGEVDALCELINEIRQKAGAAQ